MCAMMYLVYCWFMQSGPFLGGSGVLFSVYMFGLIRTVVLYLGVVVLCFYGSWVRGGGGGVS